MGWSWRTRRGGRGGVSASRRDSGARGGAAGASIPAVPACPRPAGYFPYPRFLQAVDLAKGPRYHASLRKTGFALT